MNKGNFPPLYQNIMDGLQTEQGKKAFLAVVGRAEPGDVMLYGPEKLAQRVDQLEIFLRAFIPRGFELHGCAE